jgi:hypothetical protein
MNEGKLRKDNYERLLHWRLGHTNSKVLQAMELIEKTNLNEDCFCCNKAKFKRAPFPKNEGSYDTTQPGLVKSSHSGTVP